ncbi:MAG: TrkA C-terminal domain-containing protein [Planctomycetota bacterium]
MTIGLITLLVTLVISLLITRIGSVALSLTGMATDVAKFQARSAYTGVGFTTGESEQIVNHPVRRRIVGFLMLTGNIGIAVVIASMMAAFAKGEGEVSETDWWTRISILVGFLALLWIVGTQKWVDQGIERVIAWALKKWTHLDVKDYVSLLHLANGYCVFEIKVNEGDWVSEKSLAETRLTSEGVLVLGIHRQDGNYVGSPNGRTRVEVGDTLSVYGVRDRLEELDLRKQGYEGDKAHKIAIEEQSKIQDE